MCLVARDWEDFKFLGDLLYWGDIISFLGEGAKTFSLIKASMTKHVNSRTVDGKIICFVHANFSHFYLGIFSLRICYLFKCPLKLSKKFLLLFGNNSVKV